MEVKIEKPKSMYMISQLNFMDMARASGSRYSLEYLYDKTGVDKKELLIYLTRLTKKGDNR
jgi:hypothetical protein